MLKNTKMERYFQNAFAVCDGKICVSQSKIAL